MPSKPSNSPSKAPTALRESAEWFRAVTESVTDLICVIDAGGTLLYESPGGEHTLGYVLGEQVGRDTFDLVYPDDRAVVRGALDALLRQPGMTRRVDLRLRGRDGNYRVVDVIARNLLDNAAVRGIVLNCRDITERRRIEEALQHAAQQWQATFDAVEDSIFLLDADQRICRCNRAAQALFGKSAAEMEGRHCFEIVHGAAVPPAECPVRPLCKSLHREATELVIGDRLFNVTVDPVLDAAGALAGVVHIVSDISQRKRAEAELARHREHLEELVRERAAQIEAANADLRAEINERKRTEEALQGSRRMLETVVNFMPAAVCLIRGSDFRLQLVNPAYQAIAPGKEMVGKTLDELWPESRRDFSALCRRVLETGEPYHAEDELNMVRRRPQGPLEPAYFSWSLHRVRLPDDGDQWGILKAAWETTEGMRAQEAIRANRAKLEAALDAMTDSVFICDAQGRFIDFNAAFASFYRFKNKAECLKTFAEYPDILDVFLADGQLAPLEQWAVPRALRGETASIVQYTLRRKDTGETWVGSYSFAPIRDAKGYIVGAVATARDITAIKRAEEELRAARDELELRVRQRTADLQRANEEIRAEMHQRRKAQAAVAAERQRFFDVLETLPAMISLLRPDYHVAFTNRSFRERFGEAQGRHCYEYCFGHAQPCEFCESFDVLTTGRPHKWELTTPDGHVIAAHDFPFTDVDGSPMILKMDVDITELRQAQTLLKQANEVLERRVAERTEVIQMLHDIASVANQAQDPRQAMEYCLRRLTSHGGWVCGCAWIPDAAVADILVPDYYCSREDYDRFDRLHEFTKDVRLRRGEGLAGGVFATGKTAWSTDLQHDLGGYGPAMAAELGLATAVAFPVLVGENVAAVLEFFADKPIQPDENIDEAVAGIGMQLGRVIERAEFEEHLLTIPEEVQRAMAQDLHDDVGQELTGLGLKAKTLKEMLAHDKAPAAKLAADLAATVDRTRTKVRGLAYRLLPVELEKGMLPVAIGQLIAAVNTGSGMQCTFDCARRDRLFDSRTATHLYRIAQEAVSNAIRHSGAHRIRITLQQDDGQTALQIADDGKGLPSNTLESAGMGVRTMRYRAGLIGATLAIGPGPQGGTLVVCKLPNQDATVDR